VSYNDCMIRRGHNLQPMSDPIALPATPGGDVVGNIVKVGARVRHFQIGDRVAALVRTGGNARYISVPHQQLVAVPRSCDSAEAACMVSTFMTAYQAVRLVTKDQFTMNGKLVLVTGGIEPVGQALIQLCFRAGADQVYATAPANRHKYIKSVLGAHPLPVEPNDWLPHTKGQMDVVFDGKCHDGLTSPYASLKPAGAGGGDGGNGGGGGILICVGMTALLGREPPGMFGAPLSAYWTQIKGQLLLSKSKTYEVWDSFKENPEAFKVRRPKKMKKRPRQMSFVPVWERACSIVVVVKGNERTNERTNSLNHPELLYFLLFS
jgi:NADPH:quinone reductase-like Zn-dependent oxidoreductase